MIIQWMPARMNTQWTNVDANSAIAATRALIVNRRQQNCIAMPAYVMLALLGSEYRRAL